MWAVSHRKRSFAVRVAAAVRDAGQYGVRVDGSVSVDFGAVMERMRRLRAHIAPNDSADRSSRELGIDVFIGRARFTGEDTVEVGGETLRFKKAVVATGGSAAVPPTPGLDSAPYLTNATVFNLTTRPKRLGVIGAGPIGMELAQAFRRFGSEVTAFSRDSKILPKDDADATAIVHASMVRDGVRFAFDVKHLRVESAGGQPPVTVVVERDGREESYEFDAHTGGQTPLPSLAVVGSIARRAHGTPPGLARVGFGPCAEYRLDQFVRYGVWHGRLFIVERQATQPHRFLVATQVRHAVWADLEMALEFPACFRRGLAGQIVGDEVGEFSAGHLLLRRGCAPNPTRSLRGEPECPTPRPRAVVSCASVIGCRCCGGGYAHRGVSSSEQC